MNEWSDICFNPTYMHYKNKYMRKLQDPWMGFTGYKTNQWASGKWESWIVIFFTKVTLISVQAHQTRLFVLPLEYGDSQWARNIGHFNNSFVSKLSDSYLEKFYLQSQNFLLVFHLFNCNHLKSLKRAKSLTWLSRQIDTISKEKVLK